MDNVCIEQHINNTYVINKPFIDNPIYKTNQNLRESPAILYKFQNRENYMLICVIVISGTAINHFIQSDILNVIKR